MKIDVETEIRTILNRASRENETNTPDFILAEYMMEALGAFERAVKAREKWYGRVPASYGSGPVPTLEPVKPVKPWTPKCVPAAQPDWCKTHDRSVWACLKLYAEMGVLGAE